MRHGVSGSTQLLRGMQSIEQHSFPTWQIAQFSAQPYHFPQNAITRLTCALLRG